MINTIARCYISGDTFSPGVIEREAGLQFSQKHEPGEIAVNGVYAGRPYPDGWAMLKVPFDSVTALGSTSPEEWMVDWLATYIGMLRSNGAVEIVLDLEVIWEGQCGLYFNSDLLLKAGKLGIDLQVTCYEGKVGARLADSEV